ncbi:hypothetical protein ID866_9120 [Astraeus odoratus]|nr:hypothetical protein ID866_9120 [Astraeus odoratus]
MNSIEEQHRAPVSQALLSAFISSCAGSYSGSALNNYIAGLRAWHLLHGIPWNIESNKLRSILEGASRLAPPSSKKPKQLPCEKDTLLRLLTYLNLEDARDAAIYACITVTFYSVSRLGEFTVPSLNKFALDPSRYIMRSNFTVQQDIAGLPILAFRIPVTKCSSEGEDTHSAPLEHLTDPATWLNNHLRINNPAPTDHLFSWKHPKGIRPLTKPEVTKRIHEIVTQYDLPNIKGHSLRIGGTLHYLLLGTPFDVVKTMGRWSGDSFTR